MALEPFEQSCFICGWFNRQGMLVDVQQFSTQDKAMVFANRISTTGNFPFIGKLTSYPSEIKITEK